MNSESRISILESDGLGQFERDGFQIVKSFVEHAECDLLSGDLTPLFELQRKSAKSRVGGVRNLLQGNARVSQFAKSEKLGSLLQKINGAPMFPVRGIFFDKNPETNWLVSWHQDLAISVAQRIETPGFTGWSLKDGVLHVHPPQEVLESMMTVRLHLDDCDLNNGALKIIPGSHLYGKLGATDVSNWITSCKTIICELSKGDALMMRPLLLHSSSPAINPKHRRVLHIEYAAKELPNGLKWVQC